MALTAEQEALEHQIRVAQMEADTMNKIADSRLKDEQRRWEPWKALSAAFGAGIAVASGLIAISAYVLSHIGR